MPKHVITAYFDIHVFYTVILAWGGDVEKKKNSSFMFKKTLLSSEQQIF